MTRKPLSRKYLHRIKWIVASLALLLVLSQQFPIASKSTGTDRQRYQDKTATVINVVDGDTLDIDIADPQKNKPYTRVRLWGVDTPETKRPGYPVMYYGPEATEYAIKVLLNQQVTLKLEPNENT
ncbi:MAG: thermonuclease family protein, partial [Phycisphaerae bacterium]|nr:thermonuclease family protein [Phycisphaerae bacterium]